MLIQYVAHNRIKRIQNAYRAHFARRVEAANYINYQWKTFTKSKEFKLIRRAKIEHMRKKSAINRIYDFSQNIKVKKVTARCQLMQQQIIKDLEELMQKEEVLEEKVTKIQRAWRRKRALNYKMGLRVNKDYSDKINLWQVVINQRYTTLQNADSEHLNFE